MSKETNDSFSGFMPMINQITITPETTMLSTEGELIKAHTITVTTREGDSYVFSMENYSLMKLFFLIPKVIENDIQ